MVDKNEYVGIFKHTIGMMGKGITLGMISQAIQNYAKDEWVRTQPPMKRKHIRQFFMPENIKTWAGQTNTRSADPSLSVLARLNADAMAQEQQPVPVWKPDEPEEEEDLTCVEL